MFSLNGNCIKDLYRDESHPTDLVIDLLLCLISRPLKLFVQRSKETTRNLLWVKSSLGVSTVSVFSVELVVGGNDEKKSIR